MTNRTSRLPLVTLAIACSTLGALWFASPASACITYHGDPAPGYSGMMRAFYCAFDLDGPVVEWAVPASTTVAQFSLYGADDEATGGGFVRATLPVMPMEILTLELGAEGEATSVTRSGAPSPLLVAGGGNGSEPNYLDPTATSTTVEAPGVSISGAASNGLIDVIWQFPQKEGGIDNFPLDQFNSLAAESRHCVVPPLRGKRPRMARRMLFSVGCRAGTITRKRAARSKRGLVTAQQPAAGVVLPDGSAVDLVVGRVR